MAGSTESKALPLSKGDILRSPELLEYILKTSVYPREPKEARELREESEKHREGYMTVPADEGQFLMMLLKLINAKRTIEVGVFTGYSLLCTALALPPDGKVIAIDIDKETYENAGQKFVEKAGVAHKVDFRHGDALTILENLLISEEVKEGSIDFAFVDADKDRYPLYHELLLKAVKVGGVIAYDNTLWSGMVVEGSNHPALEIKLIDDLRLAVLKLNKILANDLRIEISQLSIGDGVTLCRRIV